MEARDLMKSSKRRRSAFEMNEITNSTGDVTNQARLQIASSSSSREGLEPTHSAGPYLGPIYHLPAFRGYVGNFHQTASYSTKTWSVPGNDPGSSSEMNREYFEEQKWETVSAKEERRHHKYERDHTRDGYPRNTKSYKPHHNTGHKNNQTDSS
ncbi:hypothetical protein LOTGIDRAFT_161670, partial [Lottia gigantea]